MNRRQALKAGAGVGLFALAGCNGIGGGGDGTESLETVTEWLPDPVAFDSSLAQYSVTASTPAGKAAQLNEPRFENVDRPELEFANPNASDVDYRLQADGGTEGYGIDFDVSVGEFNADWVDQNLQNSDAYSTEGTYEDVTLYATEVGEFESSQTVYGFNDSVYIRVNESSGSDPNAVRALETVVDASEGTVTRYPDADQDMAALTDVLPPGHDLSAEISDEATETSAPERGRFEGRIGRGTVSTINGSQTEQTEVLVFVSERDIVEQDIETYVEESGQFSNYQGRPEISIDGRTVTITGPVPT